MKRKEAVYKGVNLTEVYFEDTSLTSPEYFQISEFPTRLTAGKNLFKLRGHPTNLRVGGVLNLEVLDYNGDPIYTEIVDYLEEDKSRVIAIYIYSETSPGDCTVTLVAEAVTIQGAPVPIEWQGRPNVKWSRTVPVNPNVSNETEIIFTKSPAIIVSEQIGVQLNRIYPSNEQFPTYTTGQVRYFSLNGEPAIEISSGKFSGDMKTGTITVPAPVNPAPTPNFPVVSTPYVSTIKKILSETTALLDREYTAFSSQSIAPHIYTEFAESAFSMSYEASPTYVATENSQSFALIQLKGLDPSTGDVSRIKVYTNNKGTVGTWELVNDIELEETEIFVTSTASLFPDESIGSFVSQSIIDTYWEGFTYQGKTTATAPVLTWSTASMNNAMVIGNVVDISALNAVNVVQTKEAFNGVFIEKSAYKVTIDAIGSRSADGLNPKLSVYVSGSAFSFDTTDYFNQELPRILGKRIGEIEITSNSQRIDDKVFNFESDYDGTGALLFVIEAGNWELSDVRTTTDNDAGYSPNYTRLRSVINTPHKSNNQISFKVEYYNVAGVKSKQESYLYNNSWKGGNRYIDGDYSMLTGSLYVADSLESGVAISGYKDTGFVRSLGYEGFEAGFPGFLLWSGSALSGSAGSKGGVPYSGVGLELYANTASYFRYSTSDSEIDVRTDKFFFGNPNTAYISGSNGLLEISSSKFLLSSSGAVFIEGDVNATVGNFEDVNIIGIPVFQSGSLLYFLETWFTSSTYILNAYNGTQSAAPVTSYFNYGLLGWSASNSALATPLFTSSIMSASKYSGVTTPKPPLFKQWFEYTHDNSYYPYYPYGSKQYNPVNNVQFRIPDAGTGTYTITSDIITIPVDILSSDNMEGLLLQTVAMIGPSFGGYSPSISVQIQNASGVNLKTLTYTVDNSRWNYFNIALTPILVSYDSFGSLTITNQIRIRLSWSGANTPGGGNLNWIRWGELRIIKIPQGPGLSITNVTFGDSALSSGPLFNTSGSTQHLGHFVPEDDNAYNLGISNRRWDDIYATNNVIQTSDISQKENIIDSDLGLHFINLLRPVSYKFKERSRTHYGLIAQEVSASLMQLDKTTSEFAGIVTGSLLGLRYIELLSPMIKAIQELSTEVQQLKLNQK